MSNDLIEKSPTPFQFEIDHLILLVQNLEQGCSYVEKLTGVRPLGGGRHPDYGTHNMLIGLGPDRYLEVMAPDPASKMSVSKTLFSSNVRDTPHLVRWVARTSNILTVSARAAEHNIQFGEMQSGQRSQPDGTMLTWTLTDPYHMPMGGVIPFLIDWGDTSHPAKSLRSGCRLQSLRLEHPDAASVEKVVDFLQLDVGVRQAESVRIIATLDTPRGPIVIQ